MMTQYEKLKGILREMFQMDQADLDFGIYRIMNAKRGEIEKFLDKELLPQVNEEFAKYRGSELTGKREELEKTVERLKADGADPDKSTKVMALREEIAKYGDDETLANEVFSHLSTFFRRYYDNGDFLSLRRYKKDTYAIPYEGEEVKLHWANADQYYIKTSEYLRDYAFKLADGKRAHFKLVDAVQDKDNNKTEAGKERKFKLYEEELIRVQGDEVFIQFVYLPEKEKQDNLNKKTLEILSAESSKKLKNFIELFAPAPTQKNTKRTLLEKHLYDYTARFNFDFFIHKDLGGFLNRELDFYMKNEVLFVDDLDAQDDKKLKSTIAKVRVIKHIAQKIITFLAALEDFQKKLFLKKKLVVESGYCVTLDRVPEALYSEIAKNDAQREEWVKLFAIDEIKKDLTKAGYSTPLTKEFLKANPYLVLDTKHFDEKFTDKLLASFENLDESCNGIIINSENFQALNILREKYNQKVQCIYIDPPFNSAASEIIYKNEYKNSSWMSMLENRLRLAKQLANRKSAICVAIDDYESSNLDILLNDVFSERQKLSCVTVRTNPHGRAMASGFSTNHEYALFYSIGPECVVGRLPRNEKKISRYSEADDEGPFTWMNLRKTGADSARGDRPKQYYPIYISKTGSARIPRCEWNDKINDYKILEDRPSSGEVVVFPIDEGGNERSWALGIERAKLESNTEFMAKCDEGKWQIYRKYRPHEEGALPGTWWEDAKYSATESGTRILKQLFGGREHFSYPKSVFLVEDCIRVLGLDKESTAIDFFAGSGTTGHAIINLNREDQGKRKYILVEMGEYFNVVLKPRLQKVIYSKDWNEGRPVSRDGVSHMFKYIHLESYDDSLDNLALDTSQQKTIEKIERQAREDYMLAYLLDVETKGSDSLLNIDRFADPFNYTLKIRKGNELKPNKADLVETFNYFIGLYVEQMEVVRGFKVVRGKLRTGEKTLVIWRNTKDKTNEDLDEFFKKQKYNTLDFEFDLIFVNGDNNLENLKVAEDKWKVRLIEEEFKKRMFETVGA